MTKEEFVEKHCKMCGTQRCEGIGTEYLKATKDKPKNYTTTAVGTGDNIVDRDYLDKAMGKSNINYNYGWVCPRCGKVLAPDVRECTCKPELKSNMNNPFYNTAENGYCSTGRKYTSCPEKPNHNSCQHCSNWVECVPV